ncbi:hypothetical protein BDZ91DRAFT_114623 [Kalaharituber pfeilii]|nr:hypothetical protein BDZ91DRAFT_114623 [Kalaharituber pfeilii]
MSTDANGARHTHNTNININSSMRANTNGRGRRHSLAPLDHPSASGPYPHNSLHPNTAFTRSAPALSQSPSPSPSPSRDASPRSNRGAAKLQSHEKRALVLCFDGTGNKFKGNGGDTNILKIYSMLDRRSPNQYHYYQPGIGTYLTSNAMKIRTARSFKERISSAYHKALDAAVGTSFEHHVMGGYRFLLRYYQPGDDIYMFGFSRGAYTARFLCEMLDHVGLVEQGNEEMVHFALKTFSEWQMRQNSNTEKERKRKEEMYNYMKAFQETFARPVKRVRFLGLFDTVNSVRRFETAWLSRGSKFPFTARSKARVIRHAVGLDERRAKFRLDLVEKADVGKLVEKVERHEHKMKEKVKNLKDSQKGYGTNVKERVRSWKHSQRGRKAVVKEGVVKGPVAAIAAAGKAAKEEQRKEQVVAIGAHPNASLVSLGIHFDAEDDDDDAPQDVEEVWFPGAHGDIGGGWDLAPGEPSLSYGPLVWMVREARKAGLRFDEKRLKDLGCWTDLHAEYEEEQEGEEWYEEGRWGAGWEEVINQGLTRTATAVGIEVHVQSATPPQSDQTLPGDRDLEKPACEGDSEPHSDDEGEIFHDAEDTDGANGHPSNGATAPSETGKEKRRKRKIIKDVSPATARRLLDSYTKSKIHCCLTFGGGLPHLSTLGWRMMEYLPFRRMDLQQDGTWKAISWPLPRGEVRDVPENAKVHCSVLRRMQANKDYRPGNLLVGGGGRGMRVAPPKYKTGSWVVVKEEGSLVGEIVMKKSTIINGKESAGEQQEEDTTVSLHAQEE